MSTFTDKRELDRAQNVLKFYRHKETPIRFSQLINQPVDVRNRLLSHLYMSERLVDVLSYCLMPNHFHLLLKQNIDYGISIFVSNFTNAYTKYFNSKNQRNGPLFQGTFKAVLVETDEQLLHLSRYIHINPVISSIIDEDKLDNYFYSSYPEYISLSDNEITQKDIILNGFKSSKQYENFVRNQIDYAKKLDLVKHLILE